MTRTTLGKVHGRTIQLDEDLGVPEGQQVEVQVRIIGSRKQLPGPPPGWREGGGKSTAGLLADCCSEEDDRVLEQIHADRKQERRRGIPE